MVARPSSSHSRIVAKSCGCGLNRPDGRSTIDLAGPSWAVLSDVDFLAPGERALLRPDHVVAWRGTTDPGEVRKALLSGRMPVCQDV